MEDPHMTEYTVSDSMVAQSMYVGMVVAVCIYNIICISCVCTFRYHT